MKLHANHLVSRLSLLLVLACLVLGHSFKASAQSFPAFPGATTSSGSTPFRSVGLFTYQEEVNVLYAFYADSSCLLAYSASTDGTSFQMISRPQINGSFVQADCNSVTGAQTSAVAAAVYGNAIYVGYVNPSHQFVVLKGTWQSPSRGFSFDQVWSDPNGGNLTTGAGVVLSGSNLVFVYGTSRNSNIKNYAYTTWFDGVAWHTENASGLSTPTQPGLAVYGGALYIVQKQNNSNDGIFLGNLDSTGHLSVGGHQLNTNFKTPSGLNMLVWNNELIFAGMSESTPNILYVYASTDGYNFTANGYPSLRLGATPGLAVFNNGLTVAYSSGGSSPSYVFSASHSTP